MQLKNQELTPWVKLGGIAIPFLLLTIVIILNITMRKDLFFLGMEVISDIQTNQNQIYNIFQNLVSLLGNRYLIVPILILQYLFCQRKILVFVFLIYLMGSVYFIALFKQIFQQIRPFWFDNSVTIIDRFCPAGFGHPSSHSFYIVAFYEPLFTDFVGPGVKKFFIFIWTVIVALEMFSRIYLGVHSIDQVFFGAFAGLFFLVLYRYKLQQYLYEIISNLVNQKHKRLYFICTTIACLLFFALPVATYYLNLSNRPISQIYLDNINTSCHKSVTEASMKLSSLKSTMYGFFSIGIIYGFMLLKDVHQKDTYYMVGLWKFANVKSVILFLVALSFVCVPSAVLIFAIPTVINGAISKYLSMSIGAIIGGISLVYVIPLLQNKFNWIVYTNNQLIS